mgnify:FL=1
MDIGHIYGIPTERYQESVKFKPQVNLFFKQKKEDATPEFAPIESEFSFRFVAAKDSTSITKAQVEYLASRIKSLLGGDTPFFFKKGKGMATYTDLEKGYKLQIPCYDRTEGRKVIEQILDVQGHSPDWKFMNFSTNEEPLQRYDDTPPRKLILDEQHRMPRRRPVGTVYFYKAELHLHGMLGPVPLYPVFSLP